MISKFASATIIALAVAASGTSPAVARTPFDGSWSLNIVTERGECERYTFPVQINNGHVTFPGLVNASGRVTSKGAVRVTVSAMGKTASGSGQLSRTSGRGRWAGRAGEDRCSGTWTAQRS